MKNLIIVLLFTFFSFGAFAQDNGNKEEYFKLHYPMNVYVQGHAGEVTEFWVTPDTITFKIDSLKVKIGTDWCDYSVWGGKERYCYRAITWSSLSGIVEIDYEHYPKNNANMPYDVKLIDKLCEGRLGFIYPTNRYQGHPDKEEQNNSVTLCGN